MLSLSARPSLGACRLQSAPFAAPVAVPQRANVVCMAVPKKHQSKTKTNLRFTVWKKKAEAQAQIALFKARLALKQAAAASGEAQTGEQRVEALEVRNSGSAGKKAPAALPPPATDLPKPDAPPSSPDS